MVISGGFDLGLVGLVVVLLVCHRDITGVRGLIVCSFWCQVQGFIRLRAMQ